jgi:hypothetical protein
MYVNIHTGMYVFTVCMNTVYVQYNMYISVSDRHWLYADPDTDPDPAFRVNADPDPALETNADPCGSGSWIYNKNKNKCESQKIMLNFNENKVPINILIPIKCFLKIFFMPNYLYFRYVFFFILTLFSMRIRFGIWNIDVQLYMQCWIAGASGASTFCLEA